jgi:hypothetical protein
LEKDFIMSQETFALVVGDATFHLRPDLPRDIQEKIFEIAVGTDNGFGFTSPCFYMNVTPAQLTHPHHGAGVESEWPMGKCIY